jgi:hypothetical protein
MHRLDDESTCGLEILIGPILVSLIDRFTETGNFEMVELVLGTFQRRSGRPVPNVRQQATGD